MLHELKNYSEYLSLGAEITSSMLVPLLGGYAVDYYFGTEPWGTIIGALVGFLAVFTTIFKIAQRANRKSSKKNR